MPTRIGVDVSPYSSVDEALADTGTAADGTERTEAARLAQAATELREHLALAGRPAPITADVAGTGEPSIIIALGHQLRLAGVDYAALGPQGYAIVARQGRLFVAANTGAGALHGSYRLLGLLGFAWHDPYETLMPTAAVLAARREWPLLQEVPRARLRGFWVYDTDPLPDAFALWLARNRFNLSAPARPALQRRLALHGWGGHHEQLQQEFSAPGLFERHPEWFSVIGGVRRPVAPTGNYVNPAFGNPEAAAYFAQRMVERLEHGDLRRVDVLNVWPADDRFRPFDESAQARAIGNPSDNLLVFYGRVARHLRQAHAEGRLTRPVTLAGISYFQTMEPPSSPAAVREVENEDYLHVFYPIDRSWGGPVGEAGAGREANERVMAAMRGWRSAAPRLAWGVVDYHNVSTFAAVAVTDLPHLEGNLDTFVGSGSALFATMHPLLHNPGPRRLTNMLLGELLWQTLEPAPPPRTPAIAERFFASRYGDAAAPWRALHETLALSVDNAAEMFGINSLDWLLNQDLFWPPNGFYAASDAVAMLERFTVGGAQALPAAYSGRVGDRMRLRGLPQSIAMHRRMETDWQAALARQADPAVRARMQADVLWFESTASRYRLMQAAVERAQRAAHGDETSTQRSVMAREIAILEHSPTTRDTVSPVDQRWFLWPHRVKAGIAPAPGPP